MTGSRRRIGPTIGILALLYGASATADEIRERDKAPAELYASNCAICHKSPRGLSKSGGLFGVESFLRDHYTSSRESAAAIANYLKSVDNVPAPAERRPVVRAKKKPERKTAGETKPADAKSADKPAENKATDAKASAPKADKPAEAKPELKPEPKPEPKQEAKPQTPAEKKPE